MKYLGKKSLSSFLKGLMQVSWWFVLIGAVLAFFMASYLLFTDLKEVSPQPEVNQMKAEVLAKIQNDEDFEKFLAMPAPVKALFYPYMGALVVLILMIIKKSEYIFDNFKKEIIFSEDNTVKIKETSKLLIILSIMTFNFASLILAFILLILNDIFKNGTDLQQEHDLTV